MSIVEENQNNDLKKQVKYELSITADAVISTNPQFTMDNLSLGDNYKPIDVYFVDAEGKSIKRKRNKGEKAISNQTMPRLAFQVFESEFKKLSVEEKEQFPICRYSLSSETIYGIFSSVESFKKNRNTLEFSIYKYDQDRQFVIYSWNVFATIVFVQESLKRFGKSGDQFILIYRDKDEKEKTEKEKTEIEKGDSTDRETDAEKGYMNPYADTLLASKNIIFHGAPGTGKSYLAKQLAADIISNGYYNDYSLLSEEQKEQVEFVQFHPNYDYSDFVEGLRPITYDDGNVGFELRDGVFKAFVEKARRNYESANRSKEPKLFIFIIDEINRGEISKIFGELFFSIDPGYRGEIGAVSTQYANMHSNPKEKFYIPENVYLIGTMNDIDRSVDSFDFAMRRRFRFIQIKADQYTEMLESLGDRNKIDEAVKRMTKLNKAISKVEELNDNYHIGASYFLKLDKLSYDQL